MVDSNRMMPDKLHFPRGAAADAADPVLITADASGWARCGLRVVRLEAAQSRTFLSAEDEICVLPLAGGCSVHVDRQELVLDGRESPFARVTDWAYIPIHTSFQITSVAGCELALASARATRKFDAVRIAAEDVPVEIRGAGAATRQVNNFMVPGVFDRADRLICCELLTPDGNWSSYPPHKHDDSPECTIDNEEIYYFRVGQLGQMGFCTDGYAIHRTYTANGAIDETVTVRDGDVFLVPRGYHGPCVAAPGYPLYYLNVMASADDARELAIVDDPAHAWIRDSWTGMTPDPRCPMTSAAGVVQ